MAASTVMDTLDSMIREELPALMIESLPEEDPVYRDVVRTAQGVKRDDIGRAWKVRHRFATSISGQYEARPETGGAPYTNTTQSLFYNTRQNFPNPTQTPHVGNVVRAVTLNCHHGNFGVETFNLKAEALEAAVVNDILEDLRGLAKLRSQLEAVSFYCPTDKSIGMLDISVDAGTFNASGTSTKFTVTLSNSRARWFKNGMMVDFYDDTSGTNKINDDGADVPLVVDGVDYLTGDISFVSWDGTYLDNSNLYGSGDLNTQDAYIYPRGAVTSTPTVYRTGHYGIEDWVLDSGTLFGDATAWNRTGNSDSAAMTIANYPQFKSKVATVSGALTEAVLNENLGALYDAYGVSVDTMITTAKVIQKHLEQPHLGAGRMNYDRQGRSLELKSGWASVSYEYEGREVQVKISPYCQSGVLYGLIMRNGNIKRYVPPRSMAAGGIGAPGTGVGMGDEIEFIAPMGGTSGIFKLVHDSNGRTTPMVECPFQQYSQLVPVDVRGLKLSSLTESN